MRLFVALLILALVPGCNSMFKDTPESNNQKPFIPDLTPGTRLYG